MKKIISTRRQKNTITASQMEEVHSNNLNVMNGDIQNQAMQSTYNDIFILNEYLSKQIILLSKEIEYLKSTNDNLIATVDNNHTIVSTLLTQILDETIQNKIILPKLFNQIRLDITTDLKKVFNKIDLSLSDQMRKSLDILLKDKDMILNLVKQELNKSISNLVDDKNSRDLERTISFQIGKTLIDSKKSIETLIKLPSRILEIKYEGERRKLKKKIVTVAESPKKEINTITPIPKLKSIKINVEKQSKNDLKKGFSKALTLLDPISELCWKDGFPGYAISRKKFEQQITTSTSDFAFFESAWKANKSQWLYAFNSPNLQHQNAQDLLKIIGLLRAKKMPVVFWNKEDPMHYEMFKPIAKEADYVFTTDLLKVETYKKDLGHNYVWALPFAAPIKITNPIDRFSLDTETVCFAGTYYAKNHPDRKKQMDLLLPALLENMGVIYDRASNSNSENYQYPEIYKNIIREGVDFDEMIKIYKKFKIFLNVNTITQSPTMMSRRVYELLASGTPVVSTPSKAITEQFPGIVVTVRNETEAQLAVHKLLTDSYYWNKQSVLGIREVMAKHTYEDRWKDIKSKMQGQTLSVVPVHNLRVVAIYHGYQNINQFIKNIFDQNVIVNELIILKSSKDKIEIDEEYLLRVSFVNLNEFDINNYVRKNIEGYTFFTTDSVMIFKNCILDMLLSFKYHDNYAVTRKIIYDCQDIMINNNLALDNPNWFTSITQCNLNCLLLKNNNEKYIKIDVFKQLISLTNDEKMIYVIDPFNIVHINKEIVSESLSQKYLKFKYKYETSLGI